MELPTILVASLVPKMWSVLSTSRGGERRFLNNAYHSSYSNMVGTEYTLLHVQEPILYVIRKAHRQSPDKGDRCKSAVKSML